MEQIGRYRILGEVGRGATGIVYCAQDPSIGRTVAIKTIRISDFADSSERTKLHDRLFREAQSAGMLSHPGIVTIYDISEEGDLAYIAMEFVDGPTLDRMLITDPPDGPLILSILSQTAAALDYAHKRGIVHRGIKPANIMIHERATAKITDFGVARIQSRQMTHAGSMVGTPNYMSPEQIQGQAVSGSSDQFSLAVTAYELLTGDKPFTAESMPSLVFKIVQEDPVPIQRLNSTLSWAVDTVLKRALSKKAADRYPTCSDFVFALENACRASKNWKPIAPDVMPDLPTLATAVVPSSAPVREPKPPEPLPLRQPQAESTPPPFTAPLSTPVGEPAPRLLRILRGIAVIVFSGGLIAALLILAPEHFSTDPPEVAQNTAAPPSEPRPDPTAPQPPASEPPAALPAEEQAPSPAPPAESVPPPDAAPPPKPSPDGGAEGGIATRFTTDPPGAFIVVDGTSTLSCISPCALILPRGRHSLAATKEGRRRTLRILETPANRDVFIAMDSATGTLVVRTEPRGASIYVDGKVRPEQTPAAFTLPTGNHTIEIVRNGARQTHQVTVQESVITNLTVDLPDNESNPGR